MLFKLDDGAYKPDRAHKTAYNFVDLTGEVFGHLQVIKRIDDMVYASGRKKPQYLCQCDCGKTTIVIGESLKNRSTQSCGCHRYDGFIRSSIKHGKRFTRIYSIYCNMKKRCYNKGCKAYKNYGGKGIVICDEWLNSFESFYQWSIEHGYAGDLTIDRINSSGNYEPSNCQWITLSENITKRNIEYWRKYHENEA